MKKNLYIIWREENNTEIPIIDEQHRAIISTINTLHYFILNKKLINEIDSIIIMLNQYTKFHFITEEEIMKDMNYPNFDDHKKLHDSLSEETIKVSHQVKEENDPEILLKFLKQWWLDHICVEDRKYADYLQESS